MLISGNPIVYPSEYVTEKGTPAICEYLKKEHAKLHPVEEVKPPEPPTPRIEKPPKKRPKSPKVQELLRAASKAAVASASSATSPLIRVKSLSAASNEPPMILQPRSLSPIKRRHKVTKSCSKVTVRSSFSGGSKHWVNSKQKSSSQIQEAEMRQVWLQKLRDLLEEQNKILQQEQ